MKYLSLIAFFAAVLLACQPTEKEETDLSPTYLSQGDSISQLAQAELLKNVGQAMQEGGPVHTIAFCNIQASPIMDSLSREHQATISRISFQPRNPASAASNAMDSLALQGFAQEIEQQGKAAASVVKEGENYVYYRPIRIGMETCLKCHGAPETDIALETLAKLDELYPEDQALGYAMGDLRGAWKIQF
jgi:GTP cyclohydrolase III